VPANRLGFKEYGGAFSLFQLKVIHEVITLAVFVLFYKLFYSSEPLGVHQVMAGLCLVAAVFFAFR
jgi:uncharacterized protein (DUF486 family)